MSIGELLEDYGGMCEEAAILTTVENLPHIFTFQPYLAVAEFVQPMMYIAMLHELQRKHVLIDIEDIRQYDRGVPCQE